ncbi:hypothetical protein SKAU_G00394780 [Synaphobranchus kaupii]|uniref:Uncharacterized protein n=1 Tax=Synaphobranchus kaupii TaxID=118154 RepID=A0A9Q1ID45_SYNKA|nr:hypothetical protein SKAU_G00394780 [Synaphobranchus kaupii]
MHCAGTAKGHSGQVRLSWGGGRSHRLGNTPRGFSRKRPALQDRSCAAPLGRGENEESPHVPDRTCRSSGRPAGRANPGPVTSQISADRGLQRIGRVIGGEVAVPARASPLSRAVGTWRSGGQRCGSDRYRQHPEPKLAGHQGISFQLWVGQQRGGGH